MYTTSRSALLCFLCAIFFWNFARPYENRPYEFSFNIVDFQHRYEKKGDDGLITGEYGFITGDGVYHETGYATDENGDFIITRMTYRRIKSLKDAQEIFKDRPEAAKKLVEAVARACSSCKIAGKSETPDGPRQITSTARSTESEINPDPVLDRMIQSLVQNKSSLSQDKNKIRQDAKDLQNESQSSLLQEKNKISQDAKDLQNESKSSLSQERNKIPEDAKDLQNESKSSLSQGRSKISQDAKDLQNESKSSLLQERNKISQDEKDLQNERIGKSLEAGIAKNLIDSMKSKELERKKGSEYSVSTSTETKNRKDEDTAGDLYYRFNYTITSHDHQEDGYRSGKKDGSYRAQSENGVDTRVKYLSNEFGHQPNVSFVPSSNPANETQRLEGYSFLWYRP